MNDIRLAFRSLAKAPGFTLAVVLTLTLCIGANSAVFSVIHGILLKPYPWPDSEQLVYVYNTYPLMGLPNAGVSIPDYLDRRAVSGFSDSAMYTGENLNLAGTREPEMISGLSATPSLFSTLRSSAALGRVFTDDDAKPGAQATVVLSHALWKSQFGSDPTVIGRVIRLNDKPVTVIGVMPEWFYFPGPDTKVWTPFAFTPAQRAETERGHEYSVSIARLKPGATLAGVQRELDLIQARNAERFPQAREFWRTSGFDGRVAGFLDQNVKNVRSMLWLVQGGVAAALLIGCANVAGLLLARSIGREKDLAIRKALGASRLQVARLFLTESIVLFLAGGFLGLIVAMWSVDALRMEGLSSLPRGFDVRLDPSVFAFTLGCALVAGLAAGSLPILAGARGNPTSALKEAGGRGTSGRRTQRLRAVLVASEIALAVMLVATAGLLIKSFVRMQKVDPGFVPGGTIAAQVSLPSGQYDGPEKIRAFYEQVLARLRATPGVQSAGATDFLPFSNEYDSGTYSSPDITLPPGAPAPHAMIRCADPGLLKAMGLTLLQGRWFNGSDGPSGRRVVIVDRILVERYWRDQNPIGKRIGSDSTPAIVVGVVAPSKNSSLDETTDKETLYYPLAQRPQPNLNFVVRTFGNPATLASSIRECVRAVDPSLSVFDVRTMTQRMDDAAQPVRTPVVLLSAFGGLAVVLAMLGIYGILAFSVAQRTTEFGIRMALGATAGDIAALVLKLGLLVIGIGTAMGLAGYLALSRLIAAHLFNTPPADPPTLAATTLFLVAVSFGACVVPALRATRVEPADALRQE